MSQVLQLKLGHWQNLSRILVCTAHFDPNMARECGRQALAKAHSTLTHPGVHRLTKLVCTPDPGVALVLRVGTRSLTCGLMECMQQHMKPKGLQRLLVDLYFSFVAVVGRIGWQLRS